MSQNPTSGPHNQPPVDDLARVLNSALVSTRAAEAKDRSNELTALMESPAFKAVLGAIRTLARSQMISEKDAAEQVCSTFRSLDRIWSDCLIQEGLERIKSGRN